MHCPAVEPSPERLQRLNALAAEHLVGWRWWRAKSGGSLGGKDFFLPADYIAAIGDAYFEPAPDDRDPGVMLMAIPNYAHDLNLVATLEAIVLERGLAWEYVGTLAKLTDATAVLKDGPAAVTEHFWRYATAPAWVRLEACLRVCNVEVEKA